MTLEWRPGKRYLTMPDHDALRRAVAAQWHTACGSSSGSTAARPMRPTTPAAREDYCRFVRNVLLRYGEVRDVVIWNEANSDTFWQPRESAAADYAALLARCWDVLHESVPGVNVLTTTAASHDPAAFIREVGAAYRASGRAAAALRRRRTQPVSALLQASPRTRATTSTSARATTTASSRCSTSRSPARRSRRRRSGTSRTASRRRRSGSGAARTTPAARAVARTLEPEAQAAQIAAALRLASCQPRVAAYFNFLLVDETAARRLAVRPALGRLAAQARVRGLQSGDRRGSRRPAVDCAAALRG